MEFLSKMSKKKPTVVDRSKEARKIFVKILKERENGKV